MIISNTAKCTRCGDVIYSTHVHDYRTCKCGTISVDGGQEYLRRGFQVPEDIEEMSIIMKESTIRECLESMDWANETNRNDRGKLYAILRILRDNGVDLNDR